MITIGLTGSIGMGKSTIAAQCALLGAKIISADTIVHDLMKPNGKAFTPIHTQFPTVVKNGVIDRSLLGAIVFNDAKKMLQLEAILHPLVIAEEERFAKKQKTLGIKILVLDIPLLFETGGENRMDMTMVATAPAFIQKQRVLRRAGMTEAKFTKILSKQMDDKKKRALADIIVHTSLGKAVSMRQLKILFALLRHA